MVVALGSGLGDDVVIETLDDVADGLARLRAGDYDVLLGGLTVTDGAGVEFLAPYVITGNGLAVNTRRLPHVHAVADLDGLTVRGDDRAGLEAAVADLEFGCLRCADRAGAGPGSVGARRARRRGGGALGCPWRRSRSPSRRRTPR